MAAADWLWLALLCVPVAAGLAVEVYVIVHDQWRRTLTHRLRDWFDVHTSDGKLFWTGAVVSGVAVLVWLWGHVLKVWP